MKARNIEDPQGMDAAMAINTLRRDSDDHPQQHSHITTPPQSPEPAKRTSDWVEKHSIPELVPGNRRRRSTLAKEDQPSRRDLTQNILRDADRECPPILCQIVNELAEYRYSFEEIVAALRSHFETKSNRRFYQQQWESVSLKTVIEENPDKKTLECSNHTPGQFITSVYCVSV
ncbi:hypothetical protein E4U32_005229 [Claviceps aff. humidiphila group G2b]|nr:hypothetical protein E4U32_005229 [Claviceps aff. humidiphila group G2b]